MRLGLVGARVPVAANRPGRRARARGAPDLGRPPCQGHSTLGPIRGRDAPHRPSHFWLIPLHASYAAALRPDVRIGVAVETVAETLMIMVPVAVVAHKVQEYKYLLAYLFLI